MAGLTRWEPLTRWSPMKELEDMEKRLAGLFGRTPSPSNGEKKEAIAVAEWSPFAYAVAIFVLAFFGLGYSLFPYVVIDRISIWEAAAHPSSLTITLIGAAIVLPFIIGYSALSYRIFRGKARESLYE